MTDFPYICGEDISAINNKEFIRIETDKAQAIVIALDKSDIPYSARFRDTEMVLTFDGSYREQVESIITKAMSGDYEASLRSAGRLLSAVGRGCGIDEHNYRNIAGSSR